MNIQKISCEQIWDIRHEVMYPYMPFDYVKLPDDPQGTHYGLIVREQPVSVVSVFINGHQAQFRKLATLLSEQSKGHGSTLLSFVLHKLEKESITRIWCNARADKVGFYERFGMQTTSKEFTKDGIDFIIMEKLLG